VSFFLTSAGYSAAEDITQGVREAISKAKEGLAGNTPKLCLLAATEEHNAASVRDAVRAELPGILIHGATTSLGVLGRNGVVMGSTGSIGVLLFAMKLDFRRAAPISPKEPKPLGTKPLRLSSRMVRKEKRPA
jgi:hypothetical protein